MASRDALYEEAVRMYGSALDRLARAYEAEPETRRDLLQEIHFALWSSFEKYDARCTTRTWVYRVAHNVGASHVAHDRRAKSKQFVSIETVDVADSRDDAEALANRHIAIDRLLALIRKLKPLDRQVVLLFLEGLDTTGIADVTGITAGNVATKIHRIKNVLAHRFQTGGHHVE
jgi:RNA polymerase sigma-70 factor (ECF subfamily)